MVGHSASVRRCAVAGERAVSNSRQAHAGNPAPLALAGIAVEGAIDHIQRTCEAGVAEVGYRAAGAGLPGRAVPGKGAVGHIQRTKVAYRAAGTCQVPGKGAVDHVRPSALRTTKYGAAAADRAVGTIAGEGALDHVKPLPTALIVDGPARGATAETLIGGVSGKGAVDYVDFAPVASNATAETSETICDGDVVEPEPGKGKVIHNYYPDRILPADGDGVMTIDGYSAVDGGQR